MIRPDGLYWRRLVASFFIITFIIGGIIFYENDKRELEESCRVIKCRSIIIFTFLFEYLGRYLVYSSMFALIPVVATALIFRKENGIYSGIALPIVLLISTWLPGCAWPNLGARPFVPDSFIIQLINFTGFGLLMSYIGTRIRLYLEEKEFLDDSYSVDSILHINNKHIIYITAILLCLSSSFLYIYYVVGRYAHC